MRKYYIWTTVGLLAVSLVAVAQFARAEDQVNPGQQIREENREIRKENQELRQVNKEIREDHQNLRQDRKAFGKGSEQVQGDKAKLAEDVETKKALKKERRRDREERREARRKRRHGVGN